MTSSESGPWMRKCQESSILRVRAWARLWPLRYTGQVTRYHHSPHHSPSGMQQQCTSTEYKYERRKYGYSCPAPHSDLSANDSHLPAGPMLFPGLFLPVPVVWPDTSSDWPTRP